MLLMMGFVLGLASAFIEIKFVKSSPAFARVMEQGINIPLTPWRISASMINITFSMLLSVVLGMFFGATGLVALFAGIISTCITQPYYSLEPKVLAIIDHWRTKKVKMGATRAKFNAVWADFKRPVQDTIKLVLVFLKIITFPFVAARKASAKYTAMKEAYRP